MRAERVRRETKPGRRRQRALVFALTSAGAFGLYGAGCTGDSALVGGSCGPGYTDCDGACVALATDPNDCGSCGHVCNGSACVAGRCVTTDGAIDAHDSGHRDSQADGPAHHDGTTPDAKHDAPDAPRTDGPKDDAPDGSPDGTLDVEVADGTVDGNPDAPSEAGTDGASLDAAIDATIDGTIDARTDGPLDASADQCAPPYITVTNCGACGVACAPTEVCSPNGGADGGLDAGADAAPAEAGSTDGGAYACAPACHAPLLDCGGTCVDERNDPENCGGCDNACASGICLNKVCTGVTPGDIVIIGHDYAAAHVRVSEATVLSNAVFLPPHNPLRVLSFEEYANAAQVANVEAVLKQAATASGRTITFTVADLAGTVPGDLATPSPFDVLLVYDQTAAPVSSLASIGSAWASSLSDFVATGGDVVVLDGAGGEHPQMADFLTSSNLLQTGPEVPIASGTQLLVVAPGDSVGNFVVSPYAAQNETVSFTTSESNGGAVTYVVDELANGNLVPVVIHKTPSP